jgi:uncharacterized protein (TIGR03118 family)
MKPSSARLAGLFFSAACALALYACGGGGGYGGGSGSNSMGGAGYVLAKLASDTTSGAYVATYRDPNLVNAWGLAFNPTGFAWVDNAGSSTSTLYDGNGVPQSLVVTIPSAAADAGPTGLVFNGSTSDFMIGTAPARGPSLFVFATLSGSIAAWSEALNSNQALTVVDNSASGSVYTGLALAAQGNANFLYAADFTRGKVDVFDASFAPATAGGGFVDPNLPAGYSPFGIQAIGNRIYVAYAIPDPATHEKRGAGLGVLDVFDSSGTLVKQLVPAGGMLNAPWGIALAPADFGKFSNALLVGNFGDGTINAYDPNTGAFMGQLADSNGTPIAIDGLWGIAFGGSPGFASNALYFAAGPNNETHGVFGRITAQ